MVAEHTTYVAFAPPEYAGTYRLQILKSGVVQQVDNKDRVDVAAKLSTNVLKKLNAAVNKIKSDELTKPQGPECADAPNQEIRVRQSSGANLTIWKRVNCREVNATDENAKSVADIIDNLLKAFNTIDGLAR